MNFEGQVKQIPITSIIPNRFQPRLNFDDRGLEELASSIKQHGIIQPLVVRPIGDKYEIIAGERRFKAATIAGLTTVPAIISNMDDNKSAEVAIVENVQRRNLSAIEEAKSYKNLLDKGYLSQSELAKKMGISQSAIANKLRLLNLDESVQQALLNNQISERHARSLLTLENHEDQKKWLDKIIKERLTVRDLDELLKKNSTSSSPISQTNSTDDDDDDNNVPLVKEFDLEAMKKEATELPSLSEETTRRLNEIEMEKKYNPDVVPVELAINDSKDNFFNFLENETVNMSTEETGVKNPQINVEVIDTPLQSSQSEPKLEADPEYFDPISLIETLEPDYEEKVEEQLGIDLKSAINAIREVKDTLQNKGFSLSLEELDLDDVYQFIIKIKKD